MSDILIKGMAMPERCWDCDLCYDTFYCKVLEVQFSDREDSEPSERRLSDCPLVPVPPHGRLIDADALYEKIPVNWHGDKQDIICTITGKDIKNAPTIIEAEEGE